MFYIMGLVYNLIRVQPKSASDLVWPGQLNYSMSHVSKAHCERFGKLDFEPLFIHKYTSVPFQRESIVTPLMCISVLSSFCVF